MAEKRRVPSEDRVGQKFNRLLCTGLTGRTARGIRLATFLCDCGKGHEAPLSAVVSGNTKSCGCLTKEILDARNHKHGMAGSKVYKIWADMVARCRRPSHKKYADYGGRGITVCDRWLKFENFFADMGDRPDGRSLDRVNNSKGYSPENCAWRTISEQNSNKRNNRYVEAFGINLPISWWGQLIGVGSSHLNKLLKKFHLEDIVVSRVGMDAALYIGDR